MEVEIEHSVISVAEARQFLEILRKDNLYTRLSAVGGRDGLLDGSDEVIIQRMIYLDKVFSEIKPRTVIEVGTGKGHFGMLLWLFAPSCEELVTIDTDPRSENAGDILCERLFTRFLLGSASEQVPVCGCGAELGFVCSAFTYSADTGYLQRFVDKRVGHLLMQYDANVGALEIPGYHLPHGADAGFALYKLIEQHA